MAGFTDSVFRRLCGELGADYAVSEMISAVALVRDDLKTAELAKITPGEPPVVLQLFGHDPPILADAARRLLSGSYPGCSYAAPPAGIDLNMGCPVRKIVGGGDGCALMRDPDTAARITAAVKEVCVRYDVPLSVKFRMGWDALTAPAFAKTVAEHGADRITLHCRTREQMYAPKAHPEAALAVAEAVAPWIEAGKLILCGNGDVDSPEAAQAYLDAGCREVAVGRAALGNPWLFSELRDPERFTPPTAEARKNAVLRFVEELIRERGEARGVREARGRAACFLRGTRGAAAIRDRLNRAESREEFVRILGEWNG